MSKKTIFNIILLAVILLGVSCLLYLVGDDYEQSVTLGLAYLTLVYTLFKPIETSMNKNADKVKFVKAQNLNDLETNINNELETLTNKEVIKIEVIKESNAQEIYAYIQFR